MQVKMEVSSRQGEQHISEPTQRQSTHGTHATIQRLLKISPFDTTAKYITLTSMYTPVTETIAKGAAFRAWRRAWHCKSHNS
jgi:hypothetical protein